MSEENTIFANADEAKAFAVNKIADRFEQKPEIWQAFQSLPEDERESTRSEIMTKVSKELRIDTGRTKPVDAAPSLLRTLTSAGSSMMGGRQIVGRIKEEPILRKLESAEVERDWSALQSGEIGLEDLTADEAKEMRRIAQKAEPELVGALETDPAYLREYQKASAEYAEWLKTDGYYDT